MERKEICAGIISRPGCLRVNVNSKEFHWNFIGYIVYLFCQLTYAQSHEKIRFNVPLSAEAAYPYSLQKQNLE